VINVPEFKNVPQRNSKLVIDVKGNPNLANISDHINNVRVMLLGFWVEGSVGYSSCATGNIVVEHALNRAGMQVLCSCLLHAYYQL
jgi:hypothetical protein